MFPDFDLHPFHSKLVMAHFTKAEANLVLELLQDALAVRRELIEEYGLDLSSVPSLRAELDIMESAMASIVNALP